MLHSSGRKVSVAMAACAGIAAGGISMAVAAGNKPSAEAVAMKTLVGCYQVEGGLLRLVPKAVQCRAGERVVRWNTASTTGKRGAPGAQGQAGANGAAGASGTAGTAGAMGSIGPAGAAGLPATSHLYIASSGTANVTGPTVPAGSYLIEANFTALGTGGCTVFLGDGTSQGVSNTSVPAGTPITVGATPGSIGQMDLSFPHQAKYGVTYTTPGNASIDCGGGVGNASLVMTPIEALN